MDFGKLSKGRFTYIFVSLLVAFPVFAGSVGISGQSGSSIRKDLIEWSLDRPLVWNDYLAIPDEKHPVTALTNAGFGIQTGRDANGNMFVDVKTHFDRNESWTKDTANAYLLNHEQMHFNLVEVFARETRKEISQLKIKQGKAGSDQLDKVFQSNHDKLTEKQIEYDKDTEHSVNREMQEKWNDWIAAELKRLEPFSKARVNLKIK